MLRDDGRYYEKKVMNHIETPKRVKFPLGDGTCQVVRIVVVDNNAHRVFGYNPLTNKLEDMSDLEAVDG